MSEPTAAHPKINVAAIPTRESDMKQFHYNDDGSVRELITEVWKDNLEEEFAKIREVVRTHPYVAMDTEFPGIIWRVKTASPLDYQYGNLRTNVNLLKIIQLGLTFSDSRGNLPRVGASTWQFNFRFSLSEDPYASDSISLLQQSGIDFQRFEERGVDPQHFAELMLTSGICLSDEVTWLSFHSGYDFGYLIRMLTGRDLPEDENEFHELLRILFHTVLDTKYLLKHSDMSPAVGLNMLGDELDVARIGPAHQAGSDSLLTWGTYFKMVETSFGGFIDESKFGNILFGLGTDKVAAPQTVWATLVTGPVQQARNIPPGLTMHGGNSPHSVGLLDDDTGVAPLMLRDPAIGPARAVPITDRPDTPARAQFTSGSTAADALAFRVAAPEPERIHRFHQPRGALRQ